MHDQPAIIPLRTAWKQWWLRIHRLLGKSILGILAVTSLLGSLLVFHRDIDTRMHPELFESHYVSGQKILSPSEIIARDATVKPLRLYTPADDKGVYILHYACDPALGPFGIRYIDAYDGSQRGERYWGGYFWSFIYILHSSLFLQDTGKQLLGIVAIAGLISMLSGIYLWYPRRESWRRRLDISPRAAPLRRMRNLHGILGIGAVAMIGLSCITGLHLVYPQTMKMMMGIDSPKIHAKPSAALNPIPLDQALAIGRNVFGDDPLVRVTFPSENKPSYALMFRDTNDPARSKGSNVIVLDANTGEVQQVAQWKTMSASERWLARQLPLHNGEIGGIATRILMALGGLTLTALFITGLWQWRLRARQLQARDLN